MISKAEFQEWMSHPVTVSFVEAIRDKETAVLQQLVHNLDAEISDDFYKGYYRALEDVENFSVEDTE
jgi:hypothetical protein